MCDLSQVIKLLFVHTHTHLESRSHKYIALVFLSVVYFPLLNDFELHLFTVCVRISVFFMTV